MRKRNRFAPKEIGKILKTIKLVNLLKQLNEGTEVFCCKLQSQQNEKHGPLHREIVFNLETKYRSIKRVNTGNPRKLISCFTLSLTLAQIEPKATMVSNLSHGHCFFVVLDL